MLSLMQLASIKSQWEKLMLNPNPNPDILNSGGLELDIRVTC